MYWAILEKGGAPFSICDKVYGNFFSRAISKGQRHCSIFKQNSAGELYKTICSCIYNSAVMQSRSTKSPVCNVWSVCVLLWIFKLWRWTILSWNMLLLALTAWKGHCLLREINDTVWSIERLIFVLSYSSSLTGQSFEMGARSFSLTRHSLFFTIICEWPCITHGLQHPNTTKAFLKRFYRPSDGNAAFWFL